MSRNIPLRESKGKRPVWLRRAGLPPSRRRRFAACPPAPVYRRSVFAAVGSLRSARPRQQTPAPFASLSAACVCPPLGGRCLPLAATPHRPLAFARPLRGHTYRRRAIVPLDTIRNNTNIFSWYAPPRHRPAMPPPPPPAAGLPAARRAGSGLPGGTPPGGEKQQFSEKIRIFNAFSTDISTAFELFSKKY